MSPQVLYRTSHFLENVHFGHPPGNELPSAQEFTDWCQARVEAGWRLEHITTVALDSHMVGRSRGFNVLLHTCIWVWVRSVV